MVVWWLLRVMNRDLFLVVVVAVSMFFFFFVSGFLACLGVWRFACDAGWLDLRVLCCVVCDVNVVCGCEWVGVFAVCVGGVCIVVWLLWVCVCVM